MTTIYLTDLSTESLLAEAKARNLPDTWSRNRDARPALLKALTEDIEEKTDSGLQAGENSLDTVASDQGDSGESVQGVPKRIVMEDESGE